MICSTVIQSDEGAAAAFAQHVWLLKILHPDTSPYIDHNNVERKLQQLEWQCGFPEKELTTVSDYRRRINLIIQKKEIEPHYPNLDFEKSLVHERFVKRAFNAWKYRRLGTFYQELGILAAERGCKLPRNDYFYMDIFWVASLDQALYERPVRKDAPNSPDDVEPVPVLFDNRRTSQPSGHRLRRDGPCGSPGERSLCDHAPPQPRQPAGQRHDNTPPDRPPTHQDGEPYGSPGQRGLYDHGVPQHSQPAGQHPHQNNSQQPCRIVNRSPCAREYSLCPRLNNAISQRTSTTPPPGYQLDRHEISNLVSRLQSYTAQANSLASRSDISQDSTRPNTRGTFGSCNGTLADTLELPVTYTNM